jgi:hypothetical protein
MTVTSPANGWPLSIIPENCIAFGLHHGKNGTVENFVAKSVCKCCEDQMIW